MSAPDWSRPHWTRSAERALLVYCVFGDFAPEPELDLGAQGSQGLPAGMEMRRMPRATLAHWDGHPLHGRLGEILRAGDAAAFAAARHAPECILVRGELPDAGNLDYLRDTLGVVAALVEAGGVAVVDPQILEIASASGWRERYAGAGRSEARRHILVLGDTEADGSAWIKTRGMRKFARADFSLRRVPADAVAQAGATAAHLAELGVRGMRFGDGSRVDLGAAGSLLLMRAGTLEDPEFNNLRLEASWPRSATAAPIT